MKIQVTDGIITGIIPENASGLEISINNDRYRFAHAYAYPGFMDCHGHIAGLGFQLNGLRLNAAQSAEDCARLGLNHKSRRGDWLYGTGWNNEQWISKGMPSKSLLDSFFPDSPVYYLRVDGHAAWVNSRALELAGIGSNPRQVGGGLIETDKSGTPTGILHDNAMNLLSGLIPKYSDQQVKSFIIDSLNELASKGLTEVHDMDVYPEFLDIYKELDSEGILPLKILSYLRADALERAYHYKSLSRRNLDICGLKLYADGSLGSRSAALIEPYSDDPAYRGIEVMSIDELYSHSKMAIEKGLHIAIHAIGDRGNRNVIDTYKKLREDCVADNNTILRLEHAQTIHPDDLDKISKYDIIPSVQPIHCTSDAAMAPKRLGQRCSYSYRWKSLIESGAELLAGSDFPIESHDPLTGLDAFIRRVPPGHTDSWYPAERLSRKEALESYCLNGRKRLGNNLCGKIEELYKADLTILDKDILNCPEDEIINAKVLMTICNGKVIYSSQEKSS